MFRLFLTISIVIVAIATGYYMYLTVKRTSSLNNSPKKPIIMAFDKTSYATGDIVPPLKLTYTLKFDIKLNENGLICMIGGPARITNPYEAFLAIWLNDGKLLIVCNGLSGIARINSKHPIADGSWHKIRLERDKTVLKLIIDDNAEELVPVGESVSDIIAADVIYFGGRPVNGERGVNDGVLGISACIKMVELNDTALDKIKLFGNVKTTCE